MLGEKFERVHKGTTKIVKNHECNNPKERSIKGLPKIVKNLECKNPKERLWYLVCIIEHAADPSLTLRRLTPHVATESQSNSACKVSQAVSGPISCSQQGQFEVRLSCPELHKAGSWKVLGMESSGALSGFSLLQIFAAYGFRGVVIVKTLVICKRDFEHMKRSLRMWALKSCLCPVYNTVTSALVLYMYIPNYAWITTKFFGVPWVL